MGNYRTSTLFLLSGPEIKEGLPAVHSLKPLNTWDALTYAKDVCEKIGTREEKSAGYVGGGFLTLSPGFVPRFFRRRVLHGG